MNRTSLIIGALAAASFTGCMLNQNPLSPVSPNDASGTVYMWIAPYTDTKISSENPDMNYKNSADLTAGRADIPGNVSNYQVSYIKYLMPFLPDSTQILESYFEVYHSGQTEDGTTDDVYLNLSEVGVKWNADSVTWNHGPDGGKFTPGANPMKIKLHSQDWSGTTDITPLVKRLIADTASNTEFRLTIGDQRNFFKSFYSNNDYHGNGNDAHRSDSTLGLAPRILIKIVLPAGKTTKDIYYPALPPDTDITLGRFTFTRGYVWMANYASGTPDWPATWGVKKGL
jgi:hypothetical protein